MLEGVLQRLFFTASGGSGSWSLADVRPSLKTARRPFYHWFRSGGLEFLDDQRQRQIYLGCLRGDRCSVVGRAEFAWSVGSAKSNAGVAVAYAAD